MVPSLTHPPSPPQLGLRQGWQSRFLLLQTTVSPWLTFDPTAIATTLSCCLSSEVPSGGLQPKDKSPAFPERQQVSERSSGLRLVPRATGSPSPSVGAGPSLIQRAEPTGESPATMNSVPSDHLAVAPPPPQPQLVKVAPQPKVILSSRNDPIGLNVADFLPVSLTPDP